MIKLNTPFQEFYDILIAGDTCKEALDWLAPFIGGTMGEAIDALPASSRESWSCWALSLHCDILNAGARRHLIGHIDDPMAAFIIYLRNPSLKVADDTLLEEKFRGKLPRAERELANGKVSRRKAVNRGSHSV